MLKTEIIQAELGWSFEILQHISPYFQPLIPLLTALRQRIITPMNYVNNTFYSCAITHDDMCEALVEALCKIDDQCWKRWPAPTSAALDSEPSGGPQFPSEVELEPLSEVESGSASSYSGPGSSELSDASQSRRMPRPPPMRQISRSGFATTSSSRWKLSDDADYDSGYWTAKCPRHTPPPCPCKHSPICDYRTLTQI